MQLCISWQHLWHSSELLPIGANYRLLTESVILFTSSATAIFLTFEATPLPWVHNTSSSCPKEQPPDTFFISTNIPTIFLNCLTSNNLWLIYQIQINLLSGVLGNWIREYHIRSMDWWIPINKISPWGDTVNSQSIVCPNMEISLVEWSMYIW